MIEPFNLHLVDRAPRFDAEVRFAGYLVPRRVVPGTDDEVLIGPTEASQSGVAA